MPRSLTGAFCMQKDTEYGDAIRFRAFFRLFALGLVFCG